MSALAFLRSEEVRAALARAAAAAGTPASVHYVQRNQEGPRLYGWGQCAACRHVHEEAGGALTELFLERIHAPRVVRERVLPLVTNHMVHLHSVTGRMVRRLARRLEPESIEGLGLVITADAFGRPPQPRVLPRGLIELRVKARELEVEASAPKPILRGRDLVERGWRPGPAVGVLVRGAYEAQLEGRFKDLAGALRWVEERSGRVVGSGGVVRSEESGWERGEG